MIHRTISQLSLDSVVFENRNQLYGAYELRSVYNLHLKRSLFIALFICGGFFTSVYFAGKLLLGSKTIATPIVELPYNIIEVVLEPKIKPSEPAAAKAAAIQVPATIPSEANQNYVPTAIDVNLPVELPTNEDIGSVSTGEAGVIGGVDGGTGTSLEATGTGETGSQPREEIINIAENMPEFEGGMSALYKYLSSNIRYPGMAQDTEGKVLIAFVINRFGHVDNIEIIRSIHPLLDAEAVRVIKSMPAWKPGMQNGKSVNVRMVIPIAFKLN